MNGRTRERKQLRPIRKTDLYIPSSADHEQDLETIHTYAIRVPYAKTMTTTPCPLIVPRKMPTGHSELAQYSSAFTWFWWNHNEKSPEIFTSVGCVEELAMTQDATCSREPDKSWDPKPHGRERTDKTHYSFIDNIITTKQLSFCVCVAIILSADWASSRYGCHNHARGQLYRKIRICRYIQNSAWRK